MTILSAQQVATLCHDVGFSGQALLIAVAIARGESGFKSDALGDVQLQDATWAASHGLFQIRCLRAERGTGSVRDELANVDPRHNVRSAWVISRQGTSFTPWSVFTNGTYREHVAAVWSACRAVDPTVPNEPPGQQEPVLRLTDSGPAVGELQQLLSVAGFPCDVDGAFGPQTDLAVRAFQAGRGLLADGIVGPSTWAALRTGATADGGGGDDGGKDSPPMVSQGDNGPAVTELQRRLNAAGYSCAVDGEFGPGTYDAVCAFQASHQLEVDGVVGPATWAALRSLVAATTTTGGSDT